jgi:four helix bundle protein
MEVDTQLMIAKNLSFITDEIYTKFNEELNEIIKMIQ